MESKWKGILSINWKSCNRLITIICCREVIPFQYKWEFRSKFRRILIPIKLKGDRGKFRKKEIPIKLEWDIRIDYMN